MNQHFYAKDWSDVGAFLLGFLLLLVILVFIEAYVEHRQDQKDNASRFLTPEEKENIKMLSSIEHDCQYDINNYK